ncbi:MAG: hypothetical protein AB8G95_18285 [Anaerolineae bacterium]
MSRLEKFLGNWSLIPEKSDYGLGQPPQQGTYEIVADGKKVTFLMDWIDHEGEHKTMSFSEICDGQLHPYEAPGPVDQISLTLVDEANLNSLAKNGDVVVMNATRELLSEKLMKVTMSGPLPDGGDYRNIAFYEK